MSKSGLEWKYISWKTIKAINLNLGQKKSYLKAKSEQTKNRPTRSLIVRPNWLRNGSAWMEVINGCSLGTTWQNWNMPPNHTPFSTGKRRFQRIFSHAVLSTSSERGIFVCAGRTQSQSWSLLLVRDGFVFMVHLGGIGGMRGSLYRCGQESISMKGCETSTVRLGILHRAVKIPPVLYCTC